MKQWKQKIACLLAGIMVITGFFPWNSSVSVHAEESLIKSSAEGFEYRLKVYESGIKEYICTSDTTQVYDNYQDAVKGLADISRKRIKRLMVLRRDQIRLMTQYIKKPIKKQEIQTKDRD